ncbi:MAG TPA: hypothetical protein VHW66_15820 [Stellaceae bacterium]|jgi:hypothetical protein|nr:hypothetical protein [Stellaceae bacterium]
MTRANIHDRTSLERAYPADAFARDASRNESTDAIRHGVRIGRAPDKDGWFELEHAARHAGEAEAPHFLAPTRRVADPRETAVPEPEHGYNQFLDDIVAAATRHGFKPEESPGTGDPRLRGLRGG